MFAPQRSEIWLPRQGIICACCSFILMGLALSSIFLERHFSHVWNLETILVGGVFGLLFLLNGIGFLLRIPQSTILADLMIFLIFLMVLVAWFQSGQLRYGLLPAVTVGVLIIHNGKLKKHMRTSES